MTHIFCTSEAPSYKNLYLVLKGVNYMESGVCTKNPCTVEKHLVYFAEACAFAALAIIAFCDLPYGDSILLLLVNLCCTIPLIYGLTYYNKQVITWSHTAFSVSLVVFALFARSMPLKLWFTAVVLIQVAWYIDCNRNCPITVVCNNMCDPFDARAVKADLSPIVIILIELALVVYVW